MQSVKMAAQQRRRHVGNFPKDPAGRAGGGAKAVPVMLELGLLRFVSASFCPVVRPRVRSIHGDRILVNKLFIHIRIATTSARAAYAFCSYLPSNQIC